MTEQTQPKAAAADKTSRRDVIMRKAEELFAKKGIDAVSLNEINKAAGQRNTSALHYHFGNKEGLIQEIIYQHYADISDQINALLDDYDALPPDQQTMRKLLQASLIPFANQLDSPQGINYLNIVSQLFMRSSDMILKGHPGIEDNARLRMYRLFQQRMEGLPAEIIAARQILHASLSFHSLASYAKISAVGEANFLGSRELFINNLLDNLEAVISAPPSPETLAAITSNKSK